MRKKKGASSTLYSFFIIGVVFTFALSLALIFVSKNAVSQRQAVDSQASGPSCGKLNIQVSADGTNWTEAISIQQTTGKYYLRARTDQGKACATSFAAQYSHCPLNSQNCSAPVVVSPWGAYRTNSQGIARIDFASIGEGTHMAQFREVDTQSEWSNSITVTITKAPQEKPPTVDLRSYLIFKPGYASSFITNNHLVKRYNLLTLLQVEEKTKVCGITTTPWRFTKSDQYSYWNPKMAAGGSTGLQNLRWFVVDPDFSYSKYPNFNQSFWAVGDKRYTLTSNPLQILGAVSPGLLYQSVTGKSPAYNLAPKNLPADFSYLEQSIKGSHYEQTSTLEPCTLVTNKVSSNDSSWKIRTEKDTLTINNPNFSYSGDALRIDYFEGGKSLETDPLLRESWYFIKDIGLAKIAVKQFNGFWNMGALAPSCRLDSDCLADTMEKPHLELTLDSWYHNPKLAVLVSTNNSQYSKNITTTAAQGYYLKLGKPYTGYLEAKVGNQVNKWLWVDKGLVRVTPQILSGIPKGVYPAQFRIWVPDDQFPNEKRVGDANVPWSDTISVTIQ